MDKLTSKVIMQIYPFIMHRQRWIFLDNFRGVFRWQICFNFGNSVIKIGHRLSGHYSLVLLSLRTWFLDFLYMVLATVDYMNSRVNSQHYRSTMLLKVTLLNATMAFLWVVILTCQKAIAGGLVFTFFAWENSDDT